MNAPRRFSQRYGIEIEPTEPIFEAAPDRLRLFVLEFLKQNFFEHVAIDMIGRVLCIPELTSGVALRKRLWLEVAQDKVFACAWWDIYNIMEAIFKEISGMGPGREPSYVKELNEVLSGESIGWRMDQNGQLQRLLPAVADVRQEDVFRELQVPRFQSAWTNMVVAHNAYNSRPRRDQEVCSAVFDALESVAKEVFSMPTATFGDVIKEARSKQSFEPMTLLVLDKLYALANGNFRHGMTEPFKLKPSEIEFVYLTCIGGMLMFIRA